MATKSGQIIIPTNCEQLSPASSGSIASCLEPRALIPVFLRKQTCTDLSARCLPGTIKWRLRSSAGALPKPLEELANAPGHRRAEARCATNCLEARTYHLPPPGVLNNAIAVRI